MNPDYDDWRVWKEVSGERYYLQIHEKYSQEAINSILSDLMKAAKEEGLEGCWFRFESHQEPYEDWLGNPSVEVVGYRKLTTWEANEVQEEDSKRALAEKLGVTPYELSTLIKLKESGKLVDFIKETK